MAAFQCELDEVPGEVRVTDARCARRFREARLRVQVTVGVDVDDERRAVGSQTKVDAAVVAAAERLERRHRDLDAAPLQ